MGPAGATGDLLIFPRCTTSVCVKSTLRDAIVLDYRCCHDASLRRIEDSFGWVSTSDEFVKALRVTAKPRACDTVQAVRPVTAGKLSLHAGLSKSAE